VSTIAYTLLEQSTLRRRVQSHRWKAARNHVTTMFECSVMPYGERYGYKARGFQLNCQKFAKSMCPLVNFVRSELIVWSSVAARTVQMTVILTVEDETLIGEYLGHVLKGAGYEVVATSNADEAISVLEARGDIQLVITDVNMPGSMDGLKLAAAVRDRWPPIEIIVATGRGKPSGDQMPYRSQYLPKPYVPQRVLDAVRHCGL